MGCMCGMGGREGAGTIKAAACGPGSFAPKPASVGVGKTVTWTNNGPSPHTVTSDAASEPYDSGVLNPGQTVVVIGVYNSKHHVVTYTDRVRVL